MLWGPQMIRKVLNTICVLVLLGGILAAKAEFDFTGLQVFNTKLALEEYDLEIQGGLLSWYFTDRDHYFGDFGLGLSNSWIKSQFQSDVDINSHTQITGHLRYYFYQKYIYWSAGARLFNVSGEVETEIHTSDLQLDQYYIQDNSYFIVEAPFTAGLILNEERFRLMLGIGRSFVTGSNDYSVTFHQAGTSSVVEDDYKTFQETSQTYIEASGTLFINRNTYLNIDLLLDADKNVYTGLTVARRLNF